MKADDEQPLCVGDLVAAAVDAAGRLTRDEEEATRIAAAAVWRWLRRAGRDDLAQALAQG